ncbi:hypothetical protein ED733_007968 [Metarhizium rileyi]|uniref:non-specific serine/threonine protein kinase n=1 Tax=Metarhizium rileyi (strain RCEF 4871) TaxID=1649241 RepID=A0A5C6GIC6_METRR|nr:hypothetical protein ED733_007968 [Metarhizium rileyi]
MADAMVAKVRSPLAETTNRMNSPFPVLEQQTNKPRYVQSDMAHTQHNQPATYTRPESRQAMAPQPNITLNTQMSGIIQHPYMQPVEEDKRISQASYASTSSSRSKRNYKTHIGPWQLGRTLGKGSSARVRLCRHNLTNQLAAVKIVNRRMAYLVQDSSMAALSKWDSSLPDQINGEMRVPMAIEREVAILKLIEHPNIMKLYDIWENRSEIYLILEYIDQGDLFTFINSRGRLTEEVSMCFFRQMMSAISYCHSFNVCHRDLKPENILITADLQIKIADFGMAALHQTATHQLATACGSPHYAAPELLKNKQYRGDRADIWSMGVILYAMLSATLPFDDPDLRVMMAKTKKGHYEMPKFLSPEAEDLIRRMLQVNPDRRITMKDIWKHPLVQKYRYLDDFGDNTAQLPDTRKGFQYTPVAKADIDPQLLRQLRSMWHMFSEHDLVLSLTCEEPNDQKAFYWLLYNYRNKQLEDFKPELAHSMSDYHHLKPAIWKRRISTCQFEKPRANGHGRSISRFTVISNATETEKDSYDPYRGSRMLQRCESQISHAKITVHRDGQFVTTTATGQATRARSGSNARRMRANSTRASLTSRPQSSRGSLASLRSSRQGTPQIRVPSLRHKRGVDFSHIRKRSNSAKNGLRVANHKTGSGVFSGNETTHRPSAPEYRCPSPELVKTADGTHPKAMGGPLDNQAVKQNGASMMFREELRKFSNNCAKDCDEAFKSSIVVYDSECDSSTTEGDGGRRESNPFSVSIESPTTTISPVTDASGESWHSRPLPPLPKVVTKRNQAPVLDKAGMRSTSSDKARGMDGNSGEARKIIILPLQLDRRVVSAPAHSQANRKLSTLPSINENARLHSDGARTVSAPPQSPMRQANEKNRSMDYLSKVERTIRVVNSPTPESSFRSPNPGETQTTRDGYSRHPLHQELSQNDEEYNDHIYDVEAAPKKKKSSWFKRVSRAESSTGSSDSGVRRTSSSTDSKQHRSDEESSENSRKRNFTFPFWKSNRSKDTGLEDLPEKRQVTHQTVTRKRESGMVPSKSGRTRNIEVKQNWLTRLFRVKPATIYLYMTLPSKRARQEIAILLREWRLYGIRGIQVDKQRNVVFARLGAKNHLGLREVEFAAEMITVIEHGKKQPLCIVRFTQERGAASTLHRIVNTMKVMFGSRHLLVTNKNKRKMMIETLHLQGDGEKSHQQM